MAVDVLPDVATDIVATAGDASVALTWTAPADNGSVIADYMAEYSSDEGLNWQPYDDGVSADPLMTIAGLANGTSYVFHIAAVNEYQQSGDWSTDSNAVTPAGFPGVPTDVVASRGDGFVDLSWSDPLSDNGSAVTGYLVDYSLDDGETWVQAVGQDAPVAGTTLTVPDLENGVAYVFRVAATNAVGPSDYSAWSDAVIPAGLPDSPTEVVPSRGDGAVDLTWVASAGNGSDITDYVVEYSIDDGFSWIVFDDGVSAEASVTVTGLVADTSYRFRVSALNDVGQGIWSDPTTATRPLGAPRQVTSLVVTGGNGSASLAWTAPLDDGGRPVVEYVVEYRATGATEWAAVPAAKVSLNAAAVGGLTNGVTYQFRVAARTDFATGDFPDEPLRATPLPPPTLLQGRASSGTSPVGSVALSWVAPVTPAPLPVVGYVIELSSNGGLTWTRRIDVASRATSSTVGGLINGTTYVFRVAAVTSEGEGAFSSPSIGLTPVLRSAAAVPAAPTGLVGVGGRGTVSLSWVAPNRSSGGAAVDYVIRFRLDAPGSRWFTFNRPVSAIPAALLRRLSPGQAFVFQVAGRNLNGVGAFSNAVTVRA